MLSQPDVLLHSVACSLTVKYLSYLLRHPHAQSTLRFILCMDKKYANIQWLGEPLVGGRTPRRQAHAV
jgi:hypothetical protein